MARFKYFADNGAETVEIVGAFRKGGKWFGTPVGFKPVFHEGRGWDRGVTAVTRVVEYSKTPSRHECDARCLNATGRVMKCECSCGGRNHGKGTAS